MVLDGIPLSNFVWLNELAINVSAINKKALNGADKVQVTPLLNRPITLFAESVSYDDVAAVYDHARTQFDSFNLVLRGVNYVVRWDFEKGAIESKTLRDYADAAPDELESITLNLVTV